MNNLKEIFTKWQYKGRKLANPFVIVKRLMCLLLIWPIAFILYLIIWFGFGKYAADTMLEAVM